MSNFNFSQINAKNSDDLSKFRKDKGFYKALTLVGLDPNAGHLREFAEIRLYRTPARNYACIWLRGAGMGHGQTGGWAGGYGYNREEAAIREAAEKHGISGEWFDGCKMLEALAGHLALETFLVVESFS